MVWHEAGEIVNDAAIEIGLPPWSDPYQDTDPNAIQMRGLLKSAGRELLLMRNWTYLRKEAAILTVQGQSAYPLPSDFRRMIDQSGWNRTNRLPLGGPLSPQEWQFLKARLVGVVFTVLFRPMNQEIVLYPDVNTPGGYDIRYEYESLYWVSTDATPTVLSSDAPATDTDLVWFDPLLITRALKVAFLRAKGLETIAAEQDFATTLNAVMGSDSPGKVLNLHHGFSDPSAVPIGNQSIPITGFGS